MKQSKFYFPRTCPICKADLKFHIGDGKPVKWKLDCQHGCYLAINENTEYSVIIHTEGFSPEKNKNFTWNTEVSMSTYFDIQRDIKLAIFSAKKVWKDLDQNARTKIVEVNIHFFTVTWKGKKYRVGVNSYSTKKAAELLRLPVSQVFHGAAADLPIWDPQILHTALEPK